MYWNRWYGIRSYILSTVWIAPVIALILEQITFRIAFLTESDFGWLPGFVFDNAGARAVADYVIAASIAFIVFTFSSLLVAIQVASGQLSPRIIVTTLLRDKAIRCSVALFVYSLLLAIAIKSRIETVPHFLVSLMAVLGLADILVFMFLINYAARLLRPVSIVWRIAQGGLQVLDEVYPNPIEEPSVSAAHMNLGPPARLIAHCGNSAIVIAVNINALVREARRCDVIIEFLPRVGDFVSRDDILFWCEATM